MCSQHWAVFGAWRHVSRCRLGVCALRCFATAVYCNGTVRKKKKRVIARFQTTRLFPRVDNHPACRPRGAVFTDWCIHGHTVHREPAGSPLVLRRFVVCPLSHRSPHNTQPQHTLCKSHSSSFCCEFATPRCLQKSPRGRFYMLCSRAYKLSAPRCCVPSQSHPPLRVALSNSTLLGSHIRTVFWPPVIAHARCCASLNAQKTRARLCANTVKVVAASHAVVTLLFALQ